MIPPFESVLFSRLRCSVLLDTLQSWVSKIQDSKRIFVFKGSTIDIKMAPSAITATSVPFARPRFQKTQYEDDESFADSLKSWPVHILSPLAWEGATFKSEAEYTYLLSPEEKLEVNEALAYFKG
jgi:hypothetical protein